MLALKSCCREGKAAAARSSIISARSVDALDQARHNIDVWTAEIEREGLDAIVVTASGCGTVIKDYGFLLRADPAYAAKAARVSARAKDVTEFLATLGPPSRSTSQS